MFKSSRFLLVLLIILPVAITTVVISFKKTPENLPPEIINRINVFQPQEQTAVTYLKETVENVLIGTKGTYGVAIKNLKTGETYYLNEHRIFESGSLYKIWVLATAFDQIKNGTLKQDEVLSQDISVLNEKFNIDAGSAEITDGKITLSVKNAIEQMIVTSHNYASLLLSERIKLSAVSAFLEKYNFDESTISEPPKTTPYDIALFFEKLYKGELANNENTEEMLTIFKRQQLNEGMPKYLPQNVKIAHKTGEIGWAKHDAGIVFSDSGDYIIVIMSESDSPRQAQENIALVSRAIYDYFIFRR
ncbi:hypothetical protein A2697_02455 [Candidatus Curtissbacteria bacterium RIFCSPHIGHO2_01_FULL_41_44]|uniref:Beta-lactamase class A catalytic domain-containing protein n=1 Tax=Candidatus Curtissbacteria bacterium RIFCSPLOWO2_01_FULL_42_50 TaxID=1797730 RepID=A0A1F5H1T5_9BACT|nr:MAG: hypothetical protein A2697_02455 [Candidatus Curtissbacteria bacterium RIFCSPHIGHO2_01_FULL_41_44]OGD92690.1 MAG: hypothetical protein A3C33_00990 [Candidatus Curtissbacteria bacterium RIFCSPHIGHO2_02_FULL_42_58]OGD96704.1 MAG: hypothetical protein A3E71_01230 [Candidatus Curtissbacteria bacterium RIFCSPHIGHO2_12_FULL_42_33]OGD98122.1 MAG: hypothetical protein A3B54_05675 [Candidatus Curtissbacteria bacterium RIFCSPLOWO2_01_FULL_42_50]OGE10648.1 MAG: hypothetical protein A3H87_00745 [Ca